MLDSYFDYNNLLCLRQGNGLNELLFEVDYPDTCLWGGGRTLLKEGAVELDSAEEWLLKDRVLTTTAGRAGGDPGNQLCLACTDRLVTIAAAMGKQGKELDPRDWDE